MPKSKFWVPSFIFHSLGKGGTLVLRWTHEVRGQLQEALLSFQDSVPWMGLKSSALVGSTVSCWPISLASTSPFLRLWNDYIKEIQVHGTISVLSLLPFPGQTSWKNSNVGKTQQRHTHTHTRSYMPAGNVEETGPHEHRQCILSSKEAETFNWKSNGKDRNSDDQRLTIHRTPMFHLCKCYGSPVSWGWEG